MANYTYKCYKCETIKDISHGIFEEIKITCERCGETMSRIIVSSNSILLPPTVDLDSDF